MAAYGMRFLQEPPRSRDEVKFIGGYAGTHVVSARKPGKAAITIKPLGGLAAIFQ